MDACVSGRGRGGAEGSRGGGDHGLRGGESGGQGPEHRPVP